MTPATASARQQDVLTLWGAELLLVGGLAALIASRAGPFVVVGACAVVAATSVGLTVAVKHPVRRLTANAVFALFLSFASMLPGIFFYFELLTRSGGVCYERPWFRASGAWLILGPLLMVASMSVSPWRLSSRSLLVIRALHVLVWLAGAGNTMLCAMMV